MNGVKDIRKEDVSVDVTLSVDEENLGTVSVAINMAEGKTGV